MTAPLCNGELANSEADDVVLNAASVNIEVERSDHQRMDTMMWTLVMTCVVYGGMVLLFTLISLYTAPQSAQIGTFRPVQTIPSHELVLTSLGLGLGLTVSVVLKRFELETAILLPALVVLTDLDHFPAYLGLAEPIRPAHSVIFIVCTVALMATVIRKVGVEFITLSAFFAHLSADAGVFPAFSPVSFQYYSIGEFRIPALLAAVAFALAAGFSMKRNEPGGVV